MGCWDTAPSRPGGLPRRGEFLVVSRDDGEWLKRLRGGGCSKVSLQSLGGRQVRRALPGPRARPGGPQLTVDDPCHPRSYVRRE